MLPHALLCLLHAALVAAQAKPILSLNALSSFNPQSLPNPPAFSLPSSDVLAISVALCSGNSQSPPRFFVTNDTSVGIPGQGGGPNVFEIVLSAGLGNWTGVASNGGVLAVENAGQTSFQVGVSNGGEMFLSLCSCFDVVLLSAGCKTPYAHKPIMIIVRPILLQAVRPPEVQVRLVTHLIQFLLMPALLFLHFG